MAIYYYDFHEERGEFRGYVEDANGKDVWRVTYPDFYEDEESGELVEGSNIFEDGYMKDATDIEGLEDYLKKIGVLQHGDELEFLDDDYEEEEEDDDDDEYGAGGSLETRVLKKIKDSKPFELPLEISVYVPSTQEASQIISKREYNQRVEEVQTFLANLFGGFSSVSVEGGYVSSDKGLIQEDVTRVVAFASRGGFEDKLDTLLKQIVKWCAKWSQESIGFEFEGDLFYIDAKSEFEYGGEVVFADGGDVLMEDTVQRMDDPNFADISYYGKGGALATSPTKEGITKLISEYYMGSTISLHETENPDEFEVHNLKGKINSVKVVKSKGRFRFVKSDNSYYEGGGGLSESQIKREIEMRELNQPSKLNKYKNQLSSYKRSKKIFEQKGKGFESELKLTNETIDNMESVLSYLKK
jgi:hypothetical protein